MAWITIKLVLQEDPSGCGIACLAIILGCSYSRAKSLAFGATYPGYDFRTTTKDLVRVLRSQGASVHDRLTRSSGNWSDLPDLCIVKIVEGGCAPRDWHWVVFARGVRGSVVLDPARDVPWKRPPWQPRGYLQIAL